MRSSCFNKLVLIFGPSLRHNWFILTIVGILALVVLLGSSTSKQFDTVNTSPGPDSNSSYRKLKKQAVLDNFDLRALSKGANDKQKELPFCPRERDHYVPCYNLTANRLAGFNDGDEYDRHCELLKNDERCLIRPPKD